MLAVARLAGVQAAKQTPALIPLAHPLALSYVDVEARVEPGEGLVELIAEARTTAGTGVEMEAMTAAAVAALTVYDMVKGLERGVEIEQVVLLEKRGGRSDYLLEDGAATSPDAAGAGDEKPIAAPSGAAIVTVYETGELLTTHGSLLYERTPLTASERPQPQRSCRAVRAPPLDAGRGRRSLGLGDDSDA